MGLGIPPLALWIILIIVVAPYLLSPFGALVSDLRSNRAIRRRNREEDEHDRINSIELLTSLKENGEEATIERYTNGGSPMRYHDLTIVLARRGLIRQGRHNPEYTLTRDGEHFLEQARAA